MENLSAPDQLRDHLKVTGTPVWITMIAILLLLVGLFMWSSVATLTSYASAEGIVHDGVMTVTLRSDTLEDTEPIKAGDELVCRIGDLNAMLIVSGKDKYENWIAAASIPLPEGTYDVRVGYRQIKTIRLLLN